MKCEDGEWIDARPQTHEVRRHREGRRARAASESGDMSRAQNGVYVVGDNTMLTRATACIRSKVMSR